MSELKVSLAKKQYKDHSDMKEEAFHILSQTEHQHMNKNRISDLIIFPPRNDRHPEQC